MKRYGLMVMIVAIGFSLMLAGCEKEPTREIAGAQAAVTAAKDAGADKYVPREFASMDELFKATLAAVQKQKSANPLSRNYTKIKTSLATITTTAASLREQAVVEKAKVEAYVETAIKKLNSATAEAKELVKNAPKTAKAAVEAKVKEIEAAAVKAVEVQKLKMSGDLIAARDAANTAIAELESIKAELGASTQAAAPAAAAKAKAKGKKKK
jgi:seryl-tRNA synthetase